MNMNTQPIGNPKKNLQKCPSCKKKSLIVSIFGTMCSNCLYEPLTGKPIHLGKEGGKLPPPFGNPKPIEPREEDWEKAMDDQWQETEHYLAWKFWVKDMVRKLKALWEAEARKEGREVIKEHIGVLELRLKYCQEQNGLPHCKNCGLEDSDFYKLKDLFSLLDGEIKL